MRRVPLALLGAVSFLLGLVLLISTSIRPAQRMAVHSILDPESGSSAEISLSVPAWIRLGSSEEIRFSLRRADGAAGGWVVAPELHAGGAPLRPSAKQGGSLGPGENATYVWSVTPLAAEPIRVETSLRLRTDPVAQAVLVWAASNELEVRDTLGMSVGTARAAGARLLGRCRMVDSGEDGGEEMMAELEILTFPLGLALTNAYLVGDPESGAAVVIDPGWDGRRLAQEAEARGWRIQAVWLTHAHFDHFGGSADLAESLSVPVPVALHPADQSLWRANGLAGTFGIHGLDPGPEPTIPLEPGARLWLGAHQFEVRHSPGHTPGHVMFLVRESSIAFCGDLIFRDGVGRTDLPGGDGSTLEESLRREIVSLPDEFRLLPGHGPETTVGREKRSNPFLHGLPEP